MKRLPIIDIPREFLDTHGAADGVFAARVV
jgi:hypothetical protein